MTDTIIVVLALLVSVPLCLWMVYATIRYGIIGAFDRLKIALDAIYARIAHGPAAVEPSPSIQQLEAAVAIPLEDVIRQAEAAAYKEQSWKVDA